MKQNVCLKLLVAMLVVCAVGCAEQYRSSFSETMEFEVDSVQYHAECHMWKNRQGQVSASFLTCYRPFYPIIKTHHSRPDKTFVSTHPDGEKVIAKVDTLYFVQDGKIVFEKTYQELGIDVSRLNVDGNRAILDYLLPILEKLIRENVRPPKPEMEEQQL